MIKRLLSFLNASPVSFLAVRNIADTLVANGFRQIDPRQPLGQIKGGDKFFVTKNGSSIYAFRIGHRKIAEKGFHIPCRRDTSMHIRRT